MDVEARDAVCVDPGRMEARALRGRGCWDILLAGVYRDEGRSTHLQCSLAMSECACGNYALSHFWRTRSFHTFYDRSFLPYNSTNSERRIQLRNCACSP